MLTHTEKFKKGFPCENTLRIFLDNYGRSIVFVAQIKSFSESTLFCYNYVYFLYSESRLGHETYNRMLINVMQEEPWRNSLKFLFIFLEFCYCHEIKLRLSCCKLKDHEEDTLVMLAEVLPDQPADLRCMRKPNRGWSRLAQNSRTTQPSISLWKKRKAYCFNH